MNPLNHVDDTCRKAYDMLGDAFAVLSNDYVNGQIYPVILLGLVCLAIFCWRKGDPLSRVRSFDSAPVKRSRETLYTIFVVSAGTWLGIGLVEKYDLEVGIIGIALISYICLVSPWCKKRFVTHGFMGGEDLFNDR